MATAVLQGFSFAGDTFTASVLYDTASFIVQSIQWQNLSDRNGAVQVNGPSNFVKTYTIAAGTAATSRDVSGDNIHLVSRQTTDKAGNVVIVADWPSGWSVQAHWPA